MLMILWHFTFSTVFKSYQDDEGVKMNYGKCLKISNTKGSDKMICANSADPAV